MSQFTVQPDALRAFAKTADGYGSSLDDLATAIAEAHVGRDAFGHIPMVGSRIYTAYDEHVSQAQEATRQAGDAVHVVATNATNTAKHYQDVEDANTAK